MMTSVSAGFVCYFVKIGVRIINHTAVWGNLFVFNLVEGKIQACAGSDKSRQTNKTTLWDFSSFYAVIYFCALINVRELSRVREIASRPSLCWNIASRILFQCHFSSQGCRSTIGCRGEWKFGGRWLYEFSCWTFEPGVLTRTLVWFKTRLDDLCWRHRLAAVGQPRESCFVTVLWHSWADVRVCQ
jgi:hypothetical protein